MPAVPRESLSYHSQSRHLVVGILKQRNRSNALVGSFRVQPLELTKRPQQITCFRGSVLLSKRGMQLLVPCAVRPPYLSNSSDKGGRSWEDGGHLEAELVRRGMQGLVPCGVGPPYLPNSADKGVGSWEDGGQPQLLTPQDPRSQCSIRSLSQ